MFVAAWCVLCDRLGSYSVFKQLLLENHGSASKDSLFFLKNMLAGTGFATITQYSHAADPLFAPAPRCVCCAPGATAGVLGAVVGSPFFLVKTRMQAQTEYLPTPPFSALALRVLTPSATHSSTRSVAALAVGHQYKYKNSFQYVVLVAC